MKQREKGMKQSITTALMEGYEENKRDLAWRRDQDAYRIWVSEIMLQQTRVEAVKGYYARFMEALPTLRHLAMADETELHKLWEGLGYYNRVMNMKKCAQICMENYDGCLPADYEELQKLPGIGSYTAGAIASIAYDLPVCAVDGNVMRVFSRLCNDESDIAKAAAKKHFEAVVMQYVPACGAGIFNQAIMELGALICVPNGAPHCSLCPLASFCEAHRLGITSKLPVKSAKKKRRIEQKTVVVYLYEDQLHLRKREAGGLLASLYEFDVYEGVYEEAQLTNKLQEAARLKQLVPLGKAKHIFTHLEWHMNGWLAILQEPFDQDGIWVDLDTLNKQYALPSAYQRYKDAVALWLKG